MSYLVILQRKDADGTVVEEIEIYPSTSDKSNTVFDILEEVITADPGIGGGGIPHRKTIPTEK